tara:strand:- start:9635 stop:10432 length:798 start_codon:yes stop_codon:yes gene_type:complete
MARRLNASPFIALLGVGILAKYLYSNKEVFSAEHIEEEEPTLFSKIISRFTTKEPETPVVEEGTIDVAGDFRPSDLEIIDVERTGMTVDIVPIVASNRRLPAQEGADFLNQSVQSPMVNDGAFGPGVSDVKTYKVSPFNYNLSNPFSLQKMMQRENSMFLNHDSVGQESPKMMNTHTPSKIQDIDLELDEVKGVINRKGDLARLSIQNRSNQDTLSPDVNDSYTDGFRTLALSEWMTTHHIERISDMQVMAIAISGSNQSLLRRV